MKLNASPISQYRFTTRSKSVILLVFICAGLYGAIVALTSGQDINFDWRNYHFYSVWALLHGRRGIDVAPASVQTYLNPLIHIPEYWLRVHLSPRRSAAAIGAIQGLSIGCMWLLATRLTARKEWPFAIAVVLMAASAPMAMSEYGTSFPDLLIAIPTILGLWVLLGAQSPHLIALAGIILGATVGLRLPNAPYAFGAIAVVLLHDRPVKSLLYLGLGGILGATATGGVWALKNYNEFGNPVFPFYNELFGSPDGPRVNFQDSRFLPLSFADWLTRPFQWAVGLHPTSEVPFRDWRFAIFMVLIPLAIAARIAKATPIFARRDLQFFAFFLVSYVVWSVSFSIHRYAIPLELLSGLGVALILFRVVGESNRTWVIGVVVAAILASTNSAAWDRRPFETAYAVPDMSTALPRPTAYFITHFPSAYIARSFSPGSTFFYVGDPAAVPLEGTGVFAQRIDEVLRNPPPGGFRSINDSTLLADERVMLNRLGLDIDNSDCIPIVSAAELLETCRLTYGGHGAAR